MDGVSETSSNTSVNKRQKHDGDEEVVDRISALPDALLSCILNFLPIDQAVKTCLLSKRWRFVWTTVSKLDFVDEDIIPCQLKEKKGESARWLEKFVDGVMGVRGSSHITWLRLDSSLFECSPLRVQSWISSASMCNVENLNLSTGCSKFITLPPSLYTCQGLKDLQLYGPFIFKVPDSVCLNKLKSLTIIGAAFDDRSLNKLLSSCALEDLIIQIWNRRGCMSNFCSPSLKRLSILDWSELPITSKYSVVIDTPALEQIFFFIQHGWRKNYILRSSPSLKQAKFAPCTSLNPVVYVELLKCASNINELIIALGNQDLPEGDEFQRLPVFHNLTHLEVEMDQGSWQNLSYLLDRTPNMIWLTLELGRIHHGWQQTDHVAECLSSHLKMVKITGFKGRDPEMQVVEYLLKNGKVLESMVIEIESKGSKVDVDVDPNTLAAILMKLLLLPRASSSCKVAFR